MGRNLIGSPETSDPSPAYPTSRSSARAISTASKKLFKAGVVFLGFKYSFITIKNGRDGRSAFLALYQASAELASQVGESYGSGRRRSNADMERDCEKRTACWTSHRNANSANHFFSSAMIHSRHSRPRSLLSRDMCSEVLV